MIPVDAVLIRLGKLGEMNVRIYEHRGIYWVSEEHKTKESRYGYYTLDGAPEVLKAHCIAELTTRNRIIDEALEEIKIRIRERLKNVNKRVRNRKKADQALRGTEVGSVPGSQN